MLKSWTIERKRYSEKENFSEKMLQKIKRQEGSGEETTLIGVQPMSKFTQHVSY